MFCLTFFFFSSFYFLFHDCVIILSSRANFAISFSRGISNSLIAGCKYIRNVRRQSWQILIAIDTDRLDFSFENRYCVSSGDADHHYAHVCGMREGRGLYLITNLVQKISHHHKLIQIFVNSFEWSQKSSPHSFGARATVQ